MKKTSDTNKKRAQKNLNLRATGKAVKDQSRIAVNIVSDEFAFENGDLSIGYKTFSPGTNVQFRGGSMHNNQFFAPKADKKNLGGIDLERFGFENEDPFGYFGSGSTNGQFRGGSIHNNQFFNIDEANLNSDCESGQFRGGSKHNNQFFAPKADQKNLGGTKSERLALGNEDPFGNFDSGSTNGQFRGGSTHNNQFFAPKADQKNLGGTELERFGFENEVPSERSEHDALIFGSGCTNEQSPTKNDSSSKKPAKKRKKISKENKEPSKKSKFSKKNEKEKEKKKKLKELKKIFDFDALDVEDCKLVQEVINKRLQESEKNKILEKDALPILKEASVEVLKYFERLIEKMSKRISPLLSGSTPTGEQVIVEVEEKLMEEFWRLTRKKKNRLLTKNWKSTKSQVEQKTFPKVSVESFALETKSPEEILALLKSFSKFKDLEFLEQHFIAIEGIKGLRILTKEDINEIQRKGTEEENKNFILPHKQRINQIKLEMIMEHIERLKKEKKEKERREGKKVEEGEKVDNQNENVNPRTYKESIKSTAIEVGKCRLSGLSQEDAKLKKEKVSIKYSAKFVIEWRKGIYEIAKRGTLRFNFRYKICINGFTVGN